MAVNLFDLYAKISLDDTQFSAGIDKALTSGNSLASKLGGVFNDISNVGKTAFKVIGTAIAGVTTALGGFIKSSVDAGMDFDAAMSQVKAISGATGSDFDALREKAMEMGAKTKFSATESAEAMNYMAMAGWKTNDMLNGIEGVMNLAAASGEDLARTSDIVTDAMTAFGMSADEATHFADVLAASAANSNTNVSMLGDSFKYVAPVAGSMGYTVEDTAIALGLMANNGIKASQGGTALRNILTNLANPSKTSAAAIDALGLSLTDSNGNMLSMVDLMKELRSAFSSGAIETKKIQSATVELAEQYDKGEITIEEYNEKTNKLAETVFNAAGANKAQYAAMLAGKYGMAGLLAIVNTTDEDFQKLTESIYNCDGAAEEMANTMLDNLKGDITIFNSALEGLKITISDSVTPALREFVQFGTESVNQVRDAFTSGGWEAAINVVSQVLAQMLNQFTSFIPRIATIATQFVSTFVSNIKSNIGSITVAANQILQAFTSGFNQIMEQLMPILSMLVPTIANYILTYKTQMFTIGLQIITAIAEGIADHISIIIQSGQRILENFVSTISQYAPRLISAAGQIIIVLGNGIAQALPQIMQYAGQLIVTLANGISTAIPKLIPVIQSIIDSIGKSLGDTSTISKITSAAANLILTLAEGLSKAMPNIFDAAVNIISGLLRGLTSGDSLGKIISAGLKLLDSIVQGISNAIPKLIPVAADVIGRLTGTLVAKLPEILLTGLKILESLINGIIKAIPELVAAIPRIILGFVNGVTANLGTVVKEGIQLIVKLAAGVVEGIVHLVATAPKIVASLVQAIIQLVPELGKAGLELIKGLWEGINDAGAWLWDKIKGFFGGVVDKVKGFFGIHSPSTVFAGIGGNMAKGMGEGFGDESNSVNKSIEQNAVQSVKVVANALTSAMPKIGAESGGMLIKSMMQSISQNSSQLLNSVKAIINGLNSMLGNFQNIGKNMASGILKGFQSMSGTLEAKIRQMMQRLVAAVKQEMQIHSPSGVFADIGENMVLGLAQGWNDKYVDFDKDLSNSVAGIGFGTSNMGSDSSDTETVTEYNMQVTINLNGSDYTSQRQIAEEISVQLQNLVNRRTAAWA